MRRAAANVDPGDDRMRVVIGEDQLLFRKGLTRLLEEAGFDVVGQAGDAIDLRRKVAAHRPDVAVIDIQMPPTNTDDGLRAALRIRAEHPDTSVLVLSQYVEESYALELVGDAAEVGLGARTRIVLADDSVLLREGIARLLEDAGFEIVGQAGNADELMLKVRSYSPDVAIVDIRMPPTHTTEGLDAARVIRDEQPAVGIVVLSAHVEVEHAKGLLATGHGIGYLLKTRVTDVADFVDTLERVAEGGAVIDPTLVSELVSSRVVDDPLEALTPREREVLGLMAEGRSNAGIARRIWVTEGTVEKHVQSILGKLGLRAVDDDDHRRVLAVITYLDAR